MEGFVEPSAGGEELAPRGSSTPNTMTAAPPLERPDHAASRPTTPASETAPVKHTHDTERASEILRQFRVHLSPELRQATIQLSPVELGRISIHLSMKEGRVTATLRAERKETLQVLEKHIPELKASLAQHGIEAGEFDLAMGFEDHGRRSERGPSSRSSAPDPLRVESLETKIERSRLSSAVASTAGGIDTYA